LTAVDLKEYIIHLVDLISYLRHDTSDAYVEFVNRVPVLTLLKIPRKLKSSSPAISRESHLLKLRLAWRDNIPSLYSKTYERLILRSTLLNGLFDKWLF